MPTTYTHDPHPHVEQRRLEGPVKTIDQARLHHPSAIVRLNARVGLRITVLVGTMWAAYVFGLIALVSLPSNIHSKQLFILWLSSSFLQLVLLPIIIVGQNIQATAADKRSEATFKDASAVLHEAREIQRHLEAQDAEIAKILSSLQPSS